MNQLADLMSNEQFRDAYANAVENITPADALIVAKMSAESLKEWVYSPAPIRAAKIQIARNSSWSAIDRKIADAVEDPEGPFQKVLQALQKLPGN